MHFFITMYKKDKLNNCLYKPFNRQVSFSKIKSDVKLISNAQRLPESGGGGNYGVRVRAGKGGTVKDDGAETHSQQDGHKGALFLQES